MKYIFLGTIGTNWLSKQGERYMKASAKLKQLGIKLESVHYTQGQYDFVDVVDAPGPDAVLAFSIWYSNKGLWSYSNFASIWRSSNAKSNK